MSLRVLPRRDAFLNHCLNEFSPSSKDMKAVSNSPKTAQAVGPRTIGFVWLSKVVYKAHATTIAKHWLILAAFRVSTSVVPPILLSPIFCDCRTCLYLAHSLQKTTEIKIVDSGGLLHSHRCLCRKG